MRLLVALLAASVVAKIQAQDAIPRGAAERAQYEALLRAEDARAHTDADLATLRAGLGAPNAALRRVAVRAVGRLERDALIADAAALLSDTVAAVRSAAADAVAQAAAHGGAATARTALLARLDVEPDAAVRGAIAEAFGRLPQGDTAQVHATAERLAVVAGDGAAPATIYGVARGLFLMAQQPVTRGALPAAAVARLGDLLTYGLTRPAPPAADAVAIRELAAGALTAARAATEAMFTTMQADPARGVRRVAPRGIAQLADTAAARRVGRRALADSAATVRGLAITGYARRFAAERSCATALGLAHDPDLSVRMDAVDALALPCDDRAPAVALLDSLAGTLPAPRGDDGGAWHLSAHALVALAAQAPARARARLGTFANSPAFFVRDYAARAAARAGDTALVRRLTTDRAPNVRTSAIAGLDSLLGHGADGLYLAALRDDDSQVLQTAARGLAGSRDPRAPDSLLAALDRVTGARSETSRDARVALLERLKELGTPANAPRLRPYLADFDTTVAMRAADLLGTWTGTRPTPAPVPLARAAVPDLRELETLARARVRLEMADGGVVVMRLFPYDAPTNAARFARLARAGRFDGLTLHRVVHGLLVQGGSPAANEYAGHGAYARDELGRENRRGTVGVSTRGRDTGDGQIYVNLTDWFELEHNYTILGEVVSGLDIVDRMEEGAQIRRARVVER